MSEACATGFFMLGFATGLLFQTFMVAAWVTPVVFLSMLIGAVLLIASDIKPE